MLQQVAAAIQVHGAAGLGPDTPLPALFRTGRAARILDGPDELHITSGARRPAGVRGSRTTAGSPGSAAGRPAGPRCGPHPCKNIEHIQIE
ncbi:acyl-CoA dehydrogenase family protein [Streptomyces sp. NPDC004050]